MPRPVSAPGAHRRLARGHRRGPDPASRRRRRGRLRIGDSVYFRHVKAGELCERFDRLYLVAGDRIVDELPTYRGEGKTFL